MKVKKLIKFLKTVPKDYDVIVDDVRMSDYDRTVTFVNDSHNQTNLVHKSDEELAKQTKPIDVSAFTTFPFICYWPEDIAGGCVDISDLDRIGTVDGAFVYVTRETMDKYDYNYIMDRLYHG